jgi:hypothetical protein
MNDAWLWSLVASLIILALGTTLHASRSAHGKKLADDEAARLRAQLDIRNDQVDKPPLENVSVKNGPAPVQQRADKGANGDIESIFHSILALIAKYHSQNDAATPSRIAADLSLAPEVTLAYMWEYHNKQFISFANGGKQPDVNTPFFLSPAAWQHIKVVRA